MSAAVLSQIKGYLLIIGIALLAATAVMFGLMLVGLVDLPAELIAGESTIHSIARVAIIGCLLAAVGAQR